MYHTTSIYHHYRAIIGHQTSMHQPRPCCTVAPCEERDHSCIATVALQSWLTPFPMALPHRCPHLLDIPTLHCDPKWFWRKYPSVTWNLMCDTLSHAPAIKSVRPICLLCCTTHYTLHVSLSLHCSFVVLRVYCTDFFVLPSHSTANVFLFCYFINIREVDCELVMSSLTCELQFFQLCQSLCHLKVQLLNPTCNNDHRSPSTCIPNFMSCIRRSVDVSMRQQCTTGQFCQCRQHPLYLCLLFCRCLSEPTMVSIHVTLVHRSVVMVKSSCLRVF